MEQDFFTLTLKALEHPQGLEVIKAVRHLHQEMQAHQQSDPLLKAHAYNIAKSTGVRTPKHVNHMTDSELQAWIKKQST